MQQKFKEMMEILVDKLLGVKLNDQIDALQSDCKKWQKESVDKIALTVDIKPGCEPCPFCFSGGDKLAKLVAVGINSGAPVKECQPLDENTTWQELAEFCAPVQGILSTDNSVYHMLSKKTIESKFYRDVFLIHQALVGDKRKVFDKFSDAIDAYGGRRAIETAFLEQLAKYPVFNGDFIPYKSQNAAGIDVSKMIKDKKCCNYLHGLLELLINYSEKDAYVVFYGHVDTAKNLLSQVAGEYFQKDIWIGQRLGDRANKKENQKKKPNAYFAHWRDGRIVTLIPSRVYSHVYSMREFVSKVKSFQ